MNLFQAKNLKLILNQFQKNNIKYRYNKETDFKNSKVPHIVNILLSILLYCKIG